MNPWQFLRQEIDGAARSIRYDLSLRRARRQMHSRMSADTQELPVLAPPRPDDAARKRRVILAGGGVLVIAAAVSGYLAVGNSLDALTGSGGDPASLPQRPGRARPTPTASEAQPSPSTVELSDVRLPVSQNSPLPNPPRATPSPPTGTPPVPTPAPTCSCVTPSPTVSPSPTATPSATSSPSISPSPAAQATAQTTPVNPAATR
jgi:hypothetical protein